MLVTRARVTWFQTELILLYHIYEVDIYLRGAACSNALWAARGAPSRCCYWNKTYAPIDQQSGRIGTEVGERVHCGDIVKMITRTHRAPPLADAICRKQSWGVTEKRTLLKFNCRLRHMSRYITTLGARSRLFFLEIVEYLVLLKPHNNRMQMRIGCIYCMHSWKLCLHDSRASSVLLVLLEIYLSI
jgi:hypothetical protein